MLTPNFRPESTEPRAYSHIPSEGPLLETPSSSQTMHLSPAGDRQRVPDPNVDAQSSWFFLLIRAPARSLTKLEESPIFTAGPPRTTFRISEPEPTAPPNLLRQAWNGNPRYELRAEPLLTFHVNSLSGCPSCRKPHSPLEPWA